MTRKENWPSILADQIEGARERPFCFGVHDCFLFAANVALAMTGADPAAGIRGTYDDERSALRAIARFGSFASAVIHCYGEPIDTRLAGRGDVAMVMRAGRESLAVCAGRQACGPGEFGIEWAPISEAILAWRV